VRIHLAVSLVGLLSLGFYLSPAMDLHADAAGLLLGAVMGVVAFGMVTGWRGRAAAALLVLAGPIGMLEFGVSPVIPRVEPGAGGGSERSRAAGLSGAGLRPLAAYCCTFRRPGRRFVQHPGFRQPAARAARPSIQRVKYTARSATTL